MIRYLVRGLGALVLIVALLVAGAFGWRAVLKHQNAQAFAIHSPNEIDDERFVRINGVDQWITIRGQDRRNPVLLVLHGGPGSPESYLTRYFKPMERDWVVVQWDQRGGGKTLARAGGNPDPNIDMATMVADGIAVSEYLRQRLPHDKLVIVGHSWGSILGAKLALARPEGTRPMSAAGQAASSASERQAWLYAYLVSRARAAGDAKGLAELQGGAGPPPWTDGSPAMMHMVHAAGPYLPPAVSYNDNVKAVLTDPNWSLADVMALQRGMTGMLRTRLWKRQVRDVDITGAGEVFAMPVVVIQGGSDLTTPTPFARTWLDRIQAPAKAFVVVPGQGHELLSTDNAAFTRALDANLRPLIAP